MPEMNYNTQYQDLINKLIQSKPKPPIDPLTLALLTFSEKVNQPTFMPQTNRLGSGLNEAFKTFGEETNKQNTSMRLWDAQNVDFLRAVLTDETAKAKAMAEGEQRTLENQFKQNEDLRKQEDEKRKIAERITFGKMVTEIPKIPFNEDLQEMGQLPVRVISKKFKPYMGELSGEEATNVSSDLQKQIFEAVKPIKEPMTDVKVGQTKELLYSKIARGGKLTPQEENALRRIEQVEIVGEKEKNKQEAKAIVHKEVIYPKAKAAMDKLNNQRSVAISAIDEAISKVSPWSTGIVGSFMERIPATEATDLQAIIDTIGANIGFEELKEMRASSPTGGALGNVSDKDINLLQSTLGSLKIRQSKEQLISNLKKAKEILIRTYNNQQKAFETDFRDFIRKEQSKPEEQTDLSKMSTEDLKRMLNE